MQSSFRFCFLLLIAVCGLFIAATTEKKMMVKNVSFFDGSLQSAKSKAASEGKPFFIDFTASWCMPCRWMTETTYKDTKLANYIQENYVAVKIDIDDFDGFALKEQYNIKYLPSILIFTPKGMLLAQYEESLTASKFLAVLQDYEKANVSSVPMEISLPETDENETIPAERVEPKPEPKNNLRPEPKEYNFPVLRPEKNQEKPQEKPSLTRPVIVKPARKPSLPATLVTSKPTIGEVKNLWRDNESTVVTGLYRFNVLRQPSKGYGVQLGAYLSYSNVISEVSKIQTKFATTPIIVHIENVKGKPSYKLYIGAFKKKTEAASFIKEEKLVGFIKDYASL